jgi:nucleotide-binding universal stress UspA family protein
MVAVPDITAPRTVLVALNAECEPDLAELLEVAARMAADHRVRIVILEYTFVQLYEDMEEDRDQPRTTSLTVLREARAAEHRYGVGVSAVSQRTRSPADTIIAEASRIGADMIVVAMETGRKGFGRSAGEVAGRLLAEAPCRVSFLCSQANDRGQLRNR